jgi:hypothetical protein
MGVEKWFFRSHTVTLFCAFESGPYATGISQAWVFLGLARTRSNSCPVPVTVEGKPFRNEQKAKEDAPPPYAMVSHAKKQGTAG